MGEFLPKGPRGPSMIPCCRTSHDTILVAFTDWVESQDAATNEEPQGVSPQPGRTGRSVAADGITQGIHGNSHRPWSDRADNARAGSRRSALRGAGDGADPGHSKRPAAGDS